MTKVISMDKKYKTRGGLSVRILCLDCKHAELPVVALVTEKDGHEVASTFTKTGTYFANSVSNYDLIEVSPYEDFKVDDLCVVTGYGYSGMFRYFTKEVNGTAFCFNDGTTSFTCKAENIMSWDTCRKATPEEIATKTIKS